jgi:hypothetical protein
VFVFSLWWWLLRWRWFALLMSIYRNIGSTDIDVLNKLNGNAV